MSHKKVGRNTGQSGRINPSGSELKTHVPNIGIAVQFESIDFEEISQKVIENKDTDGFLTVSHT